MTSAAGREPIACSFGSLTNATHTSLLYSTQQPYMSGVILQDDPGGNPALLTVPTEREQSPELDDTDDVEVVEDEDEEDLGSTPLGAM